MNLTPRQLDVVVAIRNYRHLNGYAPTMQELADQLGTSKVTIFEHVGALERKRVIRRDKHKARSLEIISEERLPDENRSTKLPMLGNIAAGSPIEAIENREEIDLEQMFHSRSGVYVLRVRGESMIDDHLCDGDYVVIERRENARNGEQVVALLDSGEATLKRFYREGAVRSACNRPTGPWSRGSSMPTSAGSRGWSSAYCGAIIRDSVGSRPAGDLVGRSTGELAGANALIALVLVQLSGRESVIEVKETAWLHLHAAPVLCAISTRHVRRRFRPMASGNGAKPSGRACAAAVGNSRPAAKVEAKPEAKILFQKFFHSVGPRTYAAQVKELGTAITCWC